MKRFLVAAILPLLACDTASESGPLDVPERYAFQSRFEADSGSVAYDGQTFRQVLIVSMKAEMDAIQSEIDGGAVFEPGVVAARLSFFYDFDPDTAGELRHAVSTDPAPLQATWADLGGADLVSKTAGNDREPQHRDWNVDLIGWSSTQSPEAVVREIIETCDDLAVAFSTGDIPLDPGGSAIGVWFVSAEGVDYQQLLEKFLLGAVAYSQGADDYLDEGLTADNTAQEEDEAYTALEHQWDEGFGYWGGARDYLDYTDDEIAGADGRGEYASGYHDSNDDGAIDLRSERNFGASVNAAKRDGGAAELGVELDYSEQTMRAFLRGRAIITDADGPLSETQMADLEEQRDLAVDGWERALAATAIHYFNDTLRDMATTDGAFVDLAKHWSELKGFLLMLQFNPRSQVSRETLTEIHRLVGVAPALDDADAYAADLLAARGMLAEAYAFDAALVGDDAGENGW